MSSKYSIFCDACGKDIGSTTLQIDYRIRVSSQTRQKILPMEKGSPTQAYLAPVDLCNMECLSKWVAEQSAPTTTT